MQGWGKVKDIAKYIGLSERTVRSLLKEGLPYVRLPSGTILIKYSDVDKFLVKFAVNQNEIDETVENILEEFIN